MLHRGRMALLMVGLLAAGCARHEHPLIHGAGASFPFPIYFKWFGEYFRLNAAVRINYQSIGSGGGIRQLEAGTVDFAATDVPMTDEQMRKAGQRPLHLPTVLGGVAVAYRLPVLKGQVRFTPEALAGIYLGSVKRWNDALLRKENPELAGVDHEIVVVRRSDGSGTTFAFTDYLSKVSAEWKEKVGSGSSVRWPVGLGGKGSEGVAGMIEQTPYSVGYLEFNYAVQNGIQYGAVRNRAGEFVSPTLESVEAAAGLGEGIPEDFRVSITDGAAKGGYPISTFTWLLVPERIGDAKKREAIVGFLKWMLGDGQQMAKSLNYAPLPAELVARERAAVEKLQ